MGAGKWRDEYSEQLRGIDAILFGDNDEPGRAHIEGVVRSLAGRASSVRVVPVPTGKDVTDWVAAGATRDVIDAAIQTSKEIGDSVGSQPAYKNAETRIAPGFTLNERVTSRNGYAHRCMSSRMLARRKKKNGGSFSNLRTQRIAPTNGFYLSRCWRRTQANSEAGSSAWG
jgi:DNA primase